MYRKKKVRLKKSKTDYHGRRKKSEYETIEQFFQREMEKLA